MTGFELRCIRIFNQISQYQLAEELGYSTTDPIYKAERAEFLPHKFVKAISKLVGIDFSNQKTIDDYMKKLPKELGTKYLKPRYPSLF
ncbi:MAG: hypothetical protein KIT33_00340 [Candidatus Kapabacteria bacterium]|nr:hypothetical protein [Ignavibacteriota bacterium]MCW5883396.1 hypothetical protein [Candidatus Kapabacteria bacterium]